MPSLPTATAASPDRRAAPPIPAPTPKPAAQTAAAQVQLPVPVTFKALVTEQGPKLQSGLTWRVFAAKASAEGSGYKLLSTHREAMPTAALLPGEYLVNAAYGLSNLTKKIKVESGRSLEETFVLNTGGAEARPPRLPMARPLPEGAVKFDILSDEEDQFGNRHMILHNAKPGLIIRLNAGAYRIESLYGDANAIVRADVTVEPGKVTEATIKQTGSKTTFKLVQTLGGEALADTKWTILTSAGDVVKENAGALPTHILSPGSYAVVADHGGLSYTRKFSDRAGRSQADRGGGRRRPDLAGGSESPDRSARAAAGTRRCWRHGGRRRASPLARRGRGLRRLLRDRACRPQCAADQSRRSAPRRALGVSRLAIGDFAGAGAIGLGQALIARARAASSASARLASWSSRSSPRAWRHRPRPSARICPTSMPSPAKARADQQAAMAIERVGL